MRITVVLPAYNAEKTLEQTYREIPFDIVDHVILVDDSSRDQTLQVAEKTGEIRRAATTRRWNWNQTSW